jgi:hypothetical protein
MGEEEEHTALREGTSAGRTAAAAAASILRRRDGDLEAGGLTVSVDLCCGNGLRPRNV